MALTSHASLILVCAVVLVAGIGAAAYARPRAAKSIGAALSFALPGAAFAAAALFVLDGPREMIAVPLGAVAGLCFAAAAIFIPTSRSRFREFERRFWEHVLHHEGHARPSVD